MRWLLLFLLIPFPALAESWTGRPVVHDGDSLIFAGRELRLFNVDAPELDQTCKRADDTDYPCGIESREALVRLVDSHPVVECIGTRPDQSAIRDSFKRPLVRCYIGNHIGADDIAAMMVASGWAIAEFRRADYRVFEEEAKAKRRGMWQGTFMRPREWRKANPR